MANTQTLRPWRKSSRSVNGGCVEWCVTSGGVLLRDSKDAGGPVLSFEVSQWTAFVEEVKTCRAMRGAC